MEGGTFWSCPTLFIVASRGFVTDFDGVELGLWNNLSLSDSLLLCRH